MVHLLFVLRWIKVLSAILSLIAISSAVTVTLQTLISQKWSNWREKKAIRTQISSDVVWEHEASGGLYGCKDNVLVIVWRRLFTHFLVSASFSQWVHFGGAHLKSEHTFIEGWDLIWFLTFPLNPRTGVNILQLDITNHARGQRAAKRLQLSDRPPRQHFSAPRWKSSFTRRWSVILHVYGRFTAGDIHPGRHVTSL